MRDDSVPLKITDDGLRAIGLDPNAGDAVEADAQSAAAIARRNAERRAAAEAPAQDAPTAPRGADDAAKEDVPAEEAEPTHAAPTLAPCVSLRDAVAAGAPPDRVYWLMLPCSCFSYAKAGSSPISCTSVASPVTAAPELFGFAIWISPR